MGSFIEINDTLQITTEQGFPEELDLETHLQTPYAAEDFEGRLFSFSEKPKIRIYHQPPIRVMFVQNIDEKWLYWGHVEIVTITHDYLKQTTSGTYKIVYIFTPDEMKHAEMISHTNEYSDKRFWESEN